MAFQGDSIYWVEVEKIVPNPFQPRREFDESKLKELADSVRMYGILQPLTVTRKEIQREDGTFYTEYELIAGERRLRASKLAELSQVPVIIREGEDNEQEKLELAIIENLQREDLNAVDRAFAFRQLAETFNLSHTQVAKKMGRSREYVSNSIRLLALPEYMLRSLKLGEMTEGHGRTLLMLSDKAEEQDVVFREILLKKLSVREVEKIVRKIATDKVRKKNPDEFDAELIEMEKRFMETLGTRVQIQKTDFGGKLTIDYFSVDDLEGILKNMKAEEASKLAGSKYEELNILAAHTPLQVPVEENIQQQAPQDSVEKESFVAVAENEGKQDESVLDKNSSFQQNMSQIQKIEAENIERENISAGIVSSSPEEQIAEIKEVVDEVSSEIEDVENEHYPPTVSSTPAPDVQEKVEKEVTLPDDFNHLKETEIISPAPEPVKLPTPISRPQIVARSHYKSPVYIATVEELVHQPDEQLNSSGVSEPIASPEIIQTKPETDDSGLYSMRNFSV
jgi:ParB family chromosome partitioning protein